MQLRKPILAALAGAALLFCAAVANAGDFDWTNNLNIRAEANLIDFRAQLSTRFNIGDAQVRVLLGNVDRPADAYMVLRLGEMTSRSVDDVLRHYRVEKSRGWGALAQNLGIKPGSRAFHALKQGSDLEAKGHSPNGKNKKDKKKKGKG